ncbi:hypothetical protein MRX96_028538 [Rhipicephalus microplus]
MAAGTVGKSGGEEEGLRSRTRQDWRVHRMRERRELGRTARASQPAQRGREREGLSRTEETQQREEKRR